MDGPFYISLDATERMVPDDVMDVLGKDHSDESPEDSCRWSGAFFEIKGRVNHQPAIPVFRAIDIEDELSAISESLAHPIVQPPVADNALEEHVQRESERPTLVADDGPHFIG